MKTRLHRETIREGVAGPGVLENGDEPQGEEEEKEEAKAVNQTFPVRLGRRSLAIKPMNVAESRLPKDERRSSRNRNFHHSAPDGHGDQCAQHGWDNPNIMGCPKSAGNFPKINLIKKDAHRAGVYNDAQPEVELGYCSIRSGCLMLSHDDPRRLGKAVGLDSGFDHSQIGGGRQGIFQRG